jgi:uncharacterized protein
MNIEWDASIAMDDGVVLRVDVFFPDAPGRYPVILSYGPYAKGLAFQEGYKSAWMRLTTAASDFLERKTGPPPSRGRLLQTFPSSRRAAPA